MALGSIFVGQANSQGANMHLIGMLAQQSEL